MVVPQRFPILSASQPDEAPFSGRACALSSVLGGCLCYTGNCHQMQREKLHRAVAYGNCWKVKTVHDRALTFMLLGTSMRSSRSRSWINCLSLGLGFCCHLFCSSFCSQIIASLPSWPVLEHDLHPSAPF